jgi:hypothetical protein
MPKQTNSPTAAATLLDHLVSHELQAFLRATEALRRAAAAAREATCGSPDHAEACRLSHAAEQLLLSAAARPLLAARTRAQAHQDTACAEATRSALSREHGEGRLRTKGD